MPRIFLFIFILVSSLAFSLRAIAASTVDAIKERGSIRLGVRDNHPPFSYTDGEGFVGFARDLCEGVVDAIKLKLSVPDLKVETVTATAAGFSGMLADGNIDVDCGAVPETEALRTVAGVSMPIFTSELRWLAPRPYALKGTQSLTNKSVALTPGAEIEKLVLTLSNEKTLGLSIVHTKSAADSFQLLEKGQVAAVIDRDIDLAVLRSAARNSDAYAFMDEKYLTENYVIAFRKDEEQLQLLINDAIKQSMRDGSFGKLYAKWFESSIPPKNRNLKFPMSPSLKSTSEKQSQQAMSK